MHISIFTAIEVALCYDRLLIETSEGESGKWAAFCYRVDEGHDYKMLLLSDEIFDSEEEAATFMQGTIDFLKAEHYECLVG